MAILKVARLGHPVLRKVTEPLSAREIQSAACQKFIEDMVETMKEYDGVGLAADQVHESKQIAVLEVADNPRYPEKPKVPPHGSRQPKGHRAERRNRRRLGRLSKHTRSPRQSTALQEHPRSSPGQKR